MSKKYAKKASRSRRKPSKDLDSYAATLDEEGQVTGFPQFEKAERRVEYLYATRARLAAIPEARILDAGADAASLGNCKGDVEALRKDLDAFPEKLRASLADDLNMPVAIACMAGSHITAPARAPTNLTCPCT